MFFKFVDLFGAEDFPLIRNLQHTKAVMFDISRQKAASLFFIVSEGYHPAARPAGPIWEKVLLLGSTLKRHECHPISLIFNLHHR